MIYRFVPFIVCAAISTSTALAEQTKLRVGVIIPLSGFMHEFGKAISNGIEMLKAEDPKALLCDWEYEDSKYEPKEAVTAFQNLVQRENVDLLYVFGGPITEALAPLAESRKLPLISSETEPRFSVGKKYVMRFNSPSEEFGRQLVKYFQKNGYKKLGLVHTPNQYIDGILRGLRAVLPPDIQLEEIKSVLPSENDFRTTIRQLKGKSYDALGLFTLGYQTSAFIKQMSEQKANFSKFSLDFLESTSVIDAAGPDVEGTVFPSNYPTTEFHKKYVSHYGNDAEVHWAGFGYDFAKLVTTILCERSKHSESVEKIVEMFRGSGEQKGVNGLYRFKETAEGDKYFEFPAVLRMVKGKSVVTVH